MTLKQDVSIAAGLLVLAIIFILIGTLVTWPSRTKGIAIPYSKIEDVDANTKKVTVNYNGQEKVLTVTKEVNFGQPKVQWRHTIDIEKKIVAIELNPNDDKDFDVYSGPPQYVGSIFLIIIGAILFFGSIRMTYPFFTRIKEDGIKKAIEALKDNK
jgi:hypothetical protein